MSAIGQDPVEPTGEVETPNVETPEAEAPAVEPNVGELLGGFGGTLEEFGRRLDSLTERLPEPAPVDDDGDNLASTINFSEDDFDEDGSLSLEAQTREIQRIAQSVVEETLRPQREAEAQQARDAGFDALEERYADLKDEAEQDRLLELAQQQAQKLGMPQLAAEPDFVETVYLANVARTRAGNEVPAGSERGVALERGGTAPPAAPQTAEPTDGDRIVARAQKSRFRLS
jgi:hypothetical protein